MAEKPVSAADSRLLEEDKDDGLRGSEFFEDILDKIGSRGGKFQKQLNALVGLCGFLSIHASVNHVYATYVPDHWCHVPGRELTNYTLDQWKNVTLPRVNGSLSQCEMLSVNDNGSVPCRHGWDYDHTLFSVTIPVEQNWVCDKRLDNQNAMAIAGIISTVIVVFVCYSGDRFGRKLQYAMSFSMMAIGRTLTAFTPSIYVLYIAVLSIASSGLGSAFECALSLGLEMASAERRSMVNSISVTMASLGKISCALVAWHVPHYMHLMLATSLPLFIPLAFFWWLPESPRWLTSKGRYREAFQILQRVAKVNGKELPEESMETLHKMSKRRNVQFGVMSLVTNRTLRRNTLIIALSRFVTILTMNSLSYNLGNVPMNPFLMQIAFAVLDLPSMLMFHFMSEKVGRRWSHCIFLFASAVCCGILLLITSESPSALGLGLMTVVLNMLNNCAIFVCYLQSLEIHPTSVRQTAGAVEMFFTYIAVTVAPYMAHLHVVSGGVALYGVAGTLQLVVTVAASFLPETLNQKLPETLEDADKFGALARYWSFPSRKKEIEPRGTSKNAGSKDLWRHG